MPFRRQYAANTAPGSITDRRSAHQEIQMSLKMSKAEREQFLADLHVGIVSIPRNGKGPLTVPIWYGYDPGGDVWMLTGPNSIKGKLLKKASRISLCAQSETPPYKYVSVEGPYTIGDPEADNSLTLATRYLGAEMGKAYVEGSSNEANILVRLTPEVWFTVDYGKMGA
jgi:hypothetical protein